MKTWLLTTLLCASSVVLADTTLYSEVRDLYTAGSVPNSQALRAESMWAGKCVSADYEDGAVDRRQNGLMYFHVDRDPVLGDRFFMVPLFDTPDEPSYDYEQVQAIKRVCDEDIHSVVSVDTVENSWRTDAGYGSSATIYFLRQGLTKDGATAYFLRVVQNSGTSAYCYYYLPIPDAGSLTGPIVTPPPPVE